MNKFFFGIISIILVGSIGFTSLYYGTSSSKKVLSALEERLRIDAKNNLKSVTPTIRNYLIQGNIRGARTVLESWRKNNVFQGYEIHENGELVCSHINKLNFTSKRYLTIDIPILYSSTSGKEWGKIKYFVSLEYLNAISKEMKEGFNSVFLFSAIIILLMTFLLFLSILISTQRLTILFGDYLKESKNKRSSPILTLIWGPMIKVIDEMAEKASDWRKESQEAQKLHEKEKIYRQVSHDIRSPLAAISMAMKDIDELPESARFIFRMSIQRIQDIANNLLLKTNKDKVPYDKVENVLLYSSLDEIISEKRMQFRSKVGIQIEGDLGNDFDLFSKISNSEFKRVVSNIINNAKEAFHQEKGVIKVGLQKEDDFALVRVEDNGKGIPSEHLSELGKDGASFGKELLKESGSGIGLHHAIQTVKGWGGVVSIDSTVGIGTVVTITLPLANPPSWFMSNISLTSNQTICILDDDYEIHHTWDEKFKDSGATIVHLSAPKEVRSWFFKNDHSNVLFLSDYELIGHKETGLDLIKELDLSSFSVLVTSHYGERHLQEECKKIGLKILPKMMAATISIASQDCIKKQDIYQAVYIEDDKYLRKGWKKEADKAGVRLGVIESPKNFSEIEHLVSKEFTQIYIDQNYDDLGPVKGVEFAKELHAKGYQKLYLATGHYYEELDCPNWLEVTGKESPWR